MNLERGVGRSKGCVPWNKGLKGVKHHSKDTRRKISESRLGEKNPMFGKPSTMRGKHHSEESKLRISEKHLGEKNWMFGKHWIKERSPFFGKRHIGKTKEKMSLARLGKYLGEECPSWKGGLSFSPYPTVFNGVLKRLIRKRDRDQCQNFYCEQKSSRLTTHHIDYNKEDCHPLNLITLCNGCNIKANNYREEWRRLYRVIVRRRTTENFVRMAA